MSIDPSSFHLYNVADTCAVWNVLSSRTLFRVARNAGVSLMCTGFVLYECLFKPRKTTDARDQELQARLRAARKESIFGTCRVNIADLQTVGLLENRKRLGKGELSSIALALKIDQAFLTDDKEARTLACQVLRQSKTQTTPHLLAWLFFTTRLADRDKSIIMREHEDMGRPLADSFESAYLEAFRCRLVADQGATP